MLIYNREAEWRCLEVQLAAAPVTGHADVSAEVEFVKVCVSVSLYQLGNSLRQRVFFLQTQENSLQCHHRFFWLRVGNDQPD